MRTKRRTDRPPTHLETLVYREYLRRRNPSTMPVPLDSAMLAAFRTRMLELECSALTENEIRAMASMPDVYPIESLAFHALVNYETGEYFDPYFDIND